MESMKWSTQIKVGIIVIHACSKFLGLLKNKKRLALLNYTDNKLESLNNNMVTMRFKDRPQPIEYNLSSNRTISCQYINQGVGGKILGYRGPPLTKGCIRKMTQMIDILDKVSIKTRFFIQTKSCNLLPTLIQAKQRYEIMKTDSTQMGKASREINPGSMTVNITETPKREELKMNNILTKETFLKAKAIWSAQQALKTGSEVEKYCNLKMKINHQIKQG